MQEPKFAIGVRIKDLPITPEKIVAALKSKGKSQQSSAGFISTKSSSEGTFLVIIKMDNDWVVRISIYPYFKTSSCYPQNRSLEHFARFQTAIVNHSGQDFKTSTSILKSDNGRFPL